MRPKKQHVSYDGSPVGYGKPPAEHQFRKGGKKPADSGRGKSSRNSRSIIEELFGEEITVTLNGKRQTMSKRELLIRLGYEKAIKASSINEMLALIKLYEKLAPQSVDPIPPMRSESIPGDEGL